MNEYNITPMTQVPDLALMQAMAGGDARALDELYARYGAGIFSFLMARLGGERQLAEEVLQDVMLAAWNGAGGFRGDSKVLTWLLSIARNRAINATRRRRLPAVPFHDAINARADDTGPLEKVLRQTEHRVVREALVNLPANQREVLVLVFYHHLTMNEVAGVLRISTGTVKSRLHRAKEALRRTLQLEGQLDA